MWSDLLNPGVPYLEKAVRTLAVYAFLLIGLRLAGKRELAQLNRFDFVVLLVLSNTVQNAIIGNDNSLIGGVFGAALLLVLNASVVRVLYSHPALDHLLEGDPTILIRNGKPLRGRLRREGITSERLEAAAREQGYATLAEIECARLEVDGRISFSAHRPTEEDRRHRHLMARLEHIETRLDQLGRGGA